MNVGHAFRYIQEDENWLNKFLVGALLSWVPIVGLATTGYLIHIIRRVRRNEPKPMPEWRHFGWYFQDGVKVSAGILGYYVPAILLSLVFGMLFFAMGMLSDQQNLTDLSLQVGTLTTMLVMNCGLFLLCFPPILLYPAFLMQYAQTNNIASLYDFGRIWYHIKYFSGQYTLILLVFGGLVLIASPLTIPLCGLGLLLRWYHELVIAHLIG